ncbi:trypsin-1-like [Diorhabda carinulata]|uniref:trypsin-1-like n=1 Tax=Diorhabda carinulata TaxID=1163345 RepID=UPI0025A16C72|nr:trypsin-1-like [Diorhabda carinulata]
MNLFLIVFCAVLKFVFCDQFVSPENFHEDQFRYQNSRIISKKIFGRQDASDSFINGKSYRTYNSIQKPFHVVKNTIIRGPPKNIDDTVSNLVTENIVESKPLAIIKNTTNPHKFIKQPNNVKVVDWFLGLVGIKPPQNNSTQMEPSNKCPSCTCGRTFKNVRIVGGIETMVNEYPWMTALLFNNRFYCGASLINNRYCLTAAHCVNGFAKDRITAVFLDHDRSNSFETNTVSRKIKNIYRHRGYATGGAYNNDIALLELDQEVPFTGLLKPVCLPPIGKSFTGSQGIVTGWGATKQNGQTSNRLREVKVPIMSNIDCRKTGYGNKITDNMMCAGYQGGLKDSCQGDSGGPLHTKNGSFHQIVGIVSWGEGCAKPNYPGVYTRVNRYISWIKSNTKDACYCNS